MQGIMKFGATERDPEERMREANAPDTWRPPAPCVIAAATEVDDPFAVERGISAILARGVWRQIGKKRPHAHATKTKTWNTFLFFSPKCARCLSEAPAPPHMKALSARLCGWGGRFFS
jgi:hypothetical protein